MNSHFITLNKLQSEEICAKTMQRLNFYILFRYVNDIIFAAPSESVDDILGIFNSLHSKLQFTVEVDMNNRISFLDSFLLIIEEEKLDIYLKLPSLADSLTSIHTILFVTREELSVDSQIELFAFVILGSKKII